MLIKVFYEYQNKSNLMIKNQSSDYFFKFFIKKNDSNKINAYFDIDNLYFFGD